MDVVISTVFGHGRDLDVLQMCARAFVVFFIALGLVRLGGMRAFGHKTAFDAIIVIALGAVLSRAITGVSPFWPTIGASTVLVAIHRVLGVVGVRFPRIDRVIKGSQLALFRDGVFHHRAMLRSGISRRDIEAAARQQGFASLDEVTEVYKEADGKLSVISYSPRSRRSQPGRHADPLA